MFPALCVFFEAQSLVGVRSELARYVSIASSAEKNLTLTEIHRSGTELYCSPVGTCHGQLTCKTTYIFTGQSTDQDAGRNYSLGNLLNFFSIS
ncbi:hypothetical protein GGR54DRAFT_604837 [Hypoxylon sp. NC1633]|nr:hypothetical protein GGR54DRAFT_604837 [Hypoxylon sp. NC1633]